jgi:hypothetical protein
VLRAPGCNHTLSRRPRRRRPVVSTHGWEGRQRGGGRRRSAARPPGARRSSARLLQTTRSDFVSTSSQPETPRTPADGRQSNAKRCSAMQCDAARCGAVQRNGPAWRSADLARQRVEDLDVAVPEVCLVQRRKGVRRLRLGCDHHEGIPGALAWGGARGGGRRREGGRRRAGAGRGLRGGGIARVRFPAAGEFCEPAALWLPGAACQPPLGCAAACVGPAAFSAPSARPMMEPAGGDNGGPLPRPPSPQPPPPPRAPSRRHTTTRSTTAHGWRNAATCSSAAAKGRPRRRRQRPSLGSSRGPGPPFGITRSWGRRACGRRPAVAGLAGAYLRAGRALRQRVPAAG